MSNIKIKPPKEIYKPPNQSRNSANRKNTHAAPSRNKNSKLRKILNNIKSRAVPSKILPGKFAVNIDNRYKYEILKKKREIYIHTLVDTLIELDSLRISIV